MTRKVGAYLLLAVQMVGCDAPRQSVAPTVRMNVRSPERTAESARAVTSPQFVVDLPISTKAELLPDSARQVIITRTELLAGHPLRRVLSLPPPSEASQTGVGASHKDSAFGGHILPLGKIVAAPSTDSAPIAVVYADSAVPYRVLVEVLYTLAEQGYTELFIATRSPKSTGDHAAAYGLRIRAKKSAVLTVILRPTGASLATGEWKEVDRSCHELPVGEESATSSLELGDIQRCVHEMAGNDGTIHVAADGDMSVASVVPWLESFGSVRAVTPAFPIGANWRSWSDKRKQTATGAAEVIETLRGRFQECYERELAERKCAKGTLQLRLQVDGNGSVVDVSIAVSGDLQSTGACVRSVATAAIFPPMERSPTTINVPITFRRRETPSSPELECERPHSDNR